jgi:hypothetical protein
MDPFSTIITSTERQREMRETVPSPDTLYWKALGQSETLRAVGAENNLGTGGREYRLGATLARGLMARLGRRSGLSKAENRNPRGRSESVETSHFCRARFG